VKRIVSLAILFAALIEFVIEGEKFDLWIMTVAIVMLLWNFVGRALRSRADLQKQDHDISSSRK
jgi:hypothetical protein